MVGESKTPDLPLSPPRTTTTLTRPPPTTTTTPVRIPVTTRRPPREHAHSAKTHRQYASDRRHHSGGHHHRPRDVHSPDAIPQSVAALLAVTSIPPMKSSRSLRHHRKSSPDGKRMTVESIIERSQESEKELSLTLSRSPLDLLLSPPEDLEMDDGSVCGSNVAGSVLSTRTVSMGSIPSLGESFATETPSSVESPFSSSRSRRSQPTRRVLELVSSSPGELEDHPLSSSQIAIEELDFRVFDDSPATAVKPGMRLPFQPLKSAFKSNLTASLRALRQAARSFSALNLTSIPPEDFLTRSILTLDPQVPFTDERRPSPLGEEPTAALRRYLNPTIEARIEQRSPRSKSSGPPASSASSSRSYTATIQMETYRVHRDRAASPRTGRYPSVSPELPAGTIRVSMKNGSGGSSLLQQPVTTDFAPLPDPRPREMRENPDFIRIAVMEMAMRKRGKLDDRRPMRARWALPPRKATPKPYEIGEDGVPVRWIAITYTSG